MEGDKYMKHTKQYLFITLIALVVFLTGCQKAIEPEEAGVLFVNRFIYETKDDRFEKNFVQGMELDIKLEEQRKELIEDLVTSFSEFGGVISPKQTEAFLKQWLEMVQKQAKYDVSSVKENRKEKNVTVTYSVRGINFQDVYKSTMEKLIERMLADSELMSNNVKLGDLIVQLLMESMKDAKIIDKPIKVSVTMEQVKKKWQLGAQSETETANLLLAFMAGVKDLDTYAANMSVAVNEAIADANKQVDQEFSPTPVDGKETKKETKEVSDKQTEAEKAAAEKKAKEKKEGTVETVETIETYDDSETD